MSSPKNIIHINNRRYDASTGEPIVEADPSGGKPSHHVINDIVGAGIAQPHAIRHPAPREQRQHKHVSKVSDIKRKPQKSYTLMRPAVKKPTHKTEPSQKHEPIRAVSLPLNKDRLRRAKDVPKSSHITRFHFAKKPRPIAAKPANLEVKHQSQPARRENPTAASEQKPNDWPVADQFEKAMKEASSHLESFVDQKVSKKSRKLAYITVSLVTLLVIGFGAYQAIPIAKVKIAGNKAGFSPSLPSYSPAGFGLTNPVVANYGEVTLSYKSRTDDKSFKITQEPSQWSSESLVRNFLEASDKKYQTVKGSDQTIYTYNDSDATWVDGGIWFKLEGNANLSSDQLVKIAHGL